MYTSYIGKKFLKLYKIKENKPVNYSAKIFFDEVFFPIFFDDERHLMHVGNSPFFQKTKDEDNKKFGSKSKVQLSNLHKKIQQGIPSGAIYVGYGAEEIQSTTSGQVSSINVTYDSEEMYSSWIGQALAIGINGGYALLIDEDELLLTIFDGWTSYRKYIMQTPAVKDRQIETWNGHWVCLKLNDKQDIDFTKIEIIEVAGNLAIPTKKWVQLIFTLTKKYKEKVLTSYAYTLSQTNITLGFINIYLHDIKRLYEIRDKLFLNAEETIITDSEIECLETFYNFNIACRLGSIGLKSIEPRGLREFMPKGTAEYSQGKDYKLEEKTIKSYYLYKLWIMAMLNKQELLKAAAEVAEILVSAETNKKDRGKTTQTQTSKELLDSKNIRSFIDGLNELLSEENADTLKGVVSDVLLMPTDNFPLFVTLIKFEYNYQNLNKHK